MTDQRRFSRVTFEADSSLHLGGSTLAAHLLDISLKGALVTLGDGHAPPLGAPATLELRLTGSNVVIRMQVTVAHLDESRVGLRCESIDLDSISHLRRLIELNSGDPQSIERELSALI